MNRLAHLPGGPRRPHQHLKGRLIDVDGLGKLIIHRDDRAGNRDLRGTAERSVDPM